MSLKELSWRWLTSPARPDAELAGTWPTRPAATPEAAQELTAALARGVRLGFERTAEQDVAFDTVANLAAVYVVNFVTEAPHSATAEMAVRFAQDVAFMTAYPYIRECLQDLASRIEIPRFTIGLIKRGQFQLDTEPMTSSHEAISAPGK